MKYRQLILGFALGVFFSYGAYRVIHHIQRLAAVTGIAALNVGQPAEAEDSTKKPANEMALSQFTLDAKAKLGQVTFSYDIVPSNHSADAVMQMFINVAGTWQEFTPSDDNGAIVFHLYKGLDCNGTFKINLPKGTYTAYRIILFNSPDGKTPDFNHTLWDSIKEKHLPVPKLDITVVSSAAPINSPTITYPPNPIEQPGTNGLSDVTIPAIVKYPKDYQVEGGGFWVMAKGTGGFSQVWADPKNAVQSGGADPSYYQIPIDFVLKDVKPGMWNVQFGLFKPSFGNPIAWLYPGLDFEAGGSSWIEKAPARRIPPRLKVASGQFETLAGTPYNFYSDLPAAKKSAAFVRGGNYGNAITWTSQPALDTPGFFTLLSEAGCRYIRFNFDPDKYLRQRAYRDSVDQVIQNIWSAGLYPVIAPQDLPSGDSLQQRVDQGQHLLAMVAAKYAGQSLWIEECNEPQEFQSWAQWKPVAEKYLKTIRALDPSAFVIVPLEYYSKDGGGAAASPITDAHVDLYDAHAYIDPTKVTAAYSSALKGGLPMMIGEYGSTDPDYLHEMDRAFQQLNPAPMAVSPWAFTIKGQDSLPLVEDGSTARLILTPSGQAIAKDYSSWDNGHRVN